MIGERHTGQKDSHSGEATPPRRPLPVPSAAPGPVPGGNAAHTGENGDGRDRGDRAGGNAPHARGGPGGGRCAGKRGRNPRTRERTALPRKREAIGL
ncbi:hypothetical protein GCM10010517_67320 [Streptosporangium fragile]|uniref:Uncharacterized protein n=1 Tax=Streptosporangium fragile TaxID=46186 RepID=A0ABP6IQ57_9ACTN